MTKTFDAEATVIGASLGRMDSIRLKLGIRSWRYWSRSEKLGSISAVIAAIGIVITAAAWRMPQPPVIPPIPSEECILYNDIPTESTVNVRTGCDRKSCDDEPKLIIGAYPNGTKVQRKETPAVRGKKFIWIQVVILSGGQTVWVAENKVSCKKN